MKEKRRDKREEIKEIKEKRKEKKISNRKNNHYKKTFKPYQFNVILKMISYDKYQSVRQHQSIGHINLLKQRQTQQIKHHISNITEQKTKIKAHIYKNTHTHTHARTKMEKQMRKN